MPLLEGKTPAERNKTIAALALGAIALLFLVRMFFSSSTPPRNTNTAATRRTTTTTTTVSTSAQSATAFADDPMQILRPIEYQQISVDAPAVGRNIFTFYEPPKPTPKDLTAGQNVPTPAPLPPPPLTLNGVAPGNVFAQTDTFTLTLAGDKFTPQARVYVDSQEVPTTFTSAQQLTAQVPAALIAAPGTRQIIVHTPDGVLYSNPVVLSVAESPKPQFTYIGLLGTRHYGNDKAMLKSPTSNAVISVQRGDQALQFTDVAAVQRGDIIGGRFRVTSISERSVDFMDTQLRIKHTLPYDAGKGGPGRPYIPQPPNTADDDSEEPQL